MKTMLNFLNLFINYIKYFKTFENNIKEAGSDKISKEKDIIIKPCIINEYGYEVLGDYTQTYSSGERKETIKTIKITEMIFYGFQLSSFLKHGKGEIRINSNNMSEQNKHNIKIKVNSIVFNVTAIVMIYTNLKHLCISKLIKKSVTLLGFRRIII
ncbi:hypothetical protein SLOPH_559 [Spraguea lophii 42_110]|uniref:Uncharacterized protein n=1 Tax=Spraguea lophii (strain 42_110) TaxID=1358809 RepID=S7W5F7_SPRLO|nr:hypothetical protein SLOPH_559 [Spraguea lophii 42_110]